MRAILSIIACVAVLVALALHTGCETQSAEANTVRIEPQAVGLRNGQSQEFRASGGFSYTWSLSNPSMGVLTTTEGETTVYISRTEPAVNAGSSVQTLTVTSTLGQSSTLTDTSTNGTTLVSGFTDTAHAVIENLSSGGDVSVLPTTTTTIGTTTTTSPTTTTTTTTTTSSSLFPPLP